MPNFKILVVDDHEDVRQVLAIGLETLGHETALAGDADAALATAKEFPFEIGIFDLGMDPVDGYELARLVRERYGDKHYLIALSGYDQPSNRKAALEAGFDLHVAKPLNLDRVSSLLDEAAAVLSQRRPV